MRNEQLLKRYSRMAGVEVTALHWSLAKTEVIGGHPDVDVESDFFYMSVARKLEELLGLKKEPCPVVEI